LVCENSFTWHNSTTSWSTRELSCSVPAGTYYVGLRADATQRYDNLVVSFYGVLPTPTPTATPTLPPPDHPYYWTCSPSEGPYAGTTYSANLIQNGSFEIDSSNDGVPVGGEYVRPPLHWSRSSETHLHTALYTFPAYEMASPADFATDGDWSLWHLGPGMGTDYNLLQNVWVPPGSSMQYVMAGFDARLGPNHSGSYNYNIKWGSYNLHPAGSSFIADSTWNVYSSTRNLPGGGGLLRVSINASGAQPELLVDRAFLIAYEDHEGTIIWCPSPDKYPDPTPTPQPTPWPGTPTATPTGGPGGPGLPTPGAWSTPMPPGIWITPLPTVCPVEWSPRTVNSPGFLDYFIDPIEIDVDGMRLCFAPQDVEFGADNPLVVVATAAGFDMAQLMAGMLAMLTGIMVFSWIKQR
jgi:hypothetical protein